VNKVAPSSRSIQPEIPDLLIGILVRSPLEVLDENVGSVCSRNALV